MKKLVRKSKKAKLLKGRLTLKGFIQPKKEGPYPSGDLDFIRQSLFIN